MQLVGSPNKGRKLFGVQLNSRESNYYTKEIFKHLTTSRNKIDFLMNSASHGRMEFIAHEISEQIKVKVQN